MSTNADANVFDHVFVHAPLVQKPADPLKLLPDDKKLTLRIFVDGPVAEWYVRACGCNEL